jgi:hypothetical protein
VFLEKVGGDYQGACFPFLRDDSIEGANRFAFGADGALYVGLTNRGWAAGSYGLRRVTWTGKMPLEIQKVELQADGFRVRFTRPVQAEAAGRVENYPLLHYRYEYHSGYGSDEMDKTPVRPVRVELATDRRSVKLVLPEVLAGKVYQIEVKDVVAEGDGARLRNEIAWYTLNRLKTAGE